MSSDNYTCCQLGGHLCQPLLHGSFKRFNNLHLVDLSSTSLKVVCTYVYSTTPKGAVCTNKHFSLTDQGAAGKIYRSNLKSKEILSSSLRRENSSLWFCPCPCPVFCPLFLPCILPSYLSSYKLSETAALACLKSCPFSGMTSRKTSKGLLEA